MMADGNWNTGSVMPATLRRQEWERCKPWVQAALERGGDLYAIEDVFQAVCNGDAMLWPGRKSAAVTQFIGKKNVALNFWLLGGDLNELLDEMRPAIEAWAKAQGCIRVMGVFGTRRRGWTKILPQHGYRPYWQALSKEL
jgi:hypothetical protein